MANLTKREVQSMTHNILILPAATKGKDIPVAPLSEQRKDELLKMWRGFLSGSVQPEVITVPTQVEQVVEEEIKRMPGRPTPAAEARMRLEQFLEHYYGDLPVLCMDTPTGPAVIGAGEEEVLLFQQHFPDEVCVRVQIHYPPIHFSPAN
jgi:hypothetical protein